MLSLCAIPKSATANTVRAEEERIATHPKIGRSKLFHLITILHRQQAASEK